MLIIITKLINNKYLRIKKICLKGFYYRNTKKANQTNKPRFNLIGRKKKSKRRKEKSKTGSKGKKRKKSSRK